MTRMISPMGQTFKTPGAYLWTQPEERPSLHRVRTDIAGFVGYVERVPVPPPDEAAMPYRVTSYEEFVSQFGGFIRSAYLAYAVRGFFENGGTTCWVMPVTANTATRNAQASSAPRQAVLDLPGWELDQLRLDKSSFLGTHYDKTIELAFEGTNAVAAVQAGDLLKITAKGRTAFAKVGGFPKDKNVLYLDRPVHGPLDQSAVILPLRPALQVTARSAGSWGNRLRLNLTPLGSGDTLGEFALRVTLLPGDDPTQSREEEFYNRLTLGPGIFNACDRINAYSNVIQVAVPQTNAGASPPKRRLLEEYDWVRSVAAADGRSKVKADDFIEALRALEDIDEISILCAPDAVREPLPPGLANPPAVDDPCAARDFYADNAGAASEATPSNEPPAFSPDAILQIQNAMIEQCERLRYRVAVLDSPPRNLAGVRGSTWQQQTMTWRQNFATRFGALYYPWLRVPDPVGVEGLSRRVPPSGHVAGVYAQIDNQFGVQRPPANVALEFVSDVDDEVSAYEQEALNPQDVNVIRSFSGRGIRIWGARSLARLENPPDEAWRYIHVRRLMSMIEESVQDAMQWTVFEANDYTLRQTLVHSLTVFLEAIWRQGGMQGATPSQGFFVKCDETNNPPELAAIGKLLCQIGIAVAAPMEFLVFDLRQTPEGAVVVER